MLASRPTLVTLHCPACGRPVIVEYYRDVATEIVESPVWYCPYFDCDCDMKNPLAGAREIIGVRPFTAEAKSRWVSGLRETRH